MEITHGLISTSLDNQQITFNPGSLEIIHQLLRNSFKINKTIHNGKIIPKIKTKPLERKKKKINLMLSNLRINLMSL